MSENVKTRSFFKSIVSSIEKNPIDHDENNLCELVKKAKQEWQTAQKVFNDVCEPDLIDYAIYNMEAAEKKYIYLVKKVKEIKDNKIKNKL